MLRTLRLNQSEALQIRAEKLGADPDRANFFDVIISRALSDLTSFVINALPLLAKHGRIIAMKGEVDQKELEAVRADIAKKRYSIEVENYNLPAIHKRRSIIIIKHFHQKVDRR
jgi:16S rRNA (guanine527-N7)-methyltransferase